MEEPLISSNAVHFVPLPSDTISLDDLREASHSLIRFENLILLRTLGEGGGGARGWMNVGQTINAGGFSTVFSSTIIKIKINR